MEFDVKKPLKGREEIVAAVNTYKDALRRQERETSNGLLNSCLPLFVLSLLPVLLIVVASALAPPIADLTTSESTDYSSDIEKSEEIIAAEIEKQLATLETNPDLKTAQGLVNELSKLEQDAAKAASKPATQNHGRYRSLTIFFLVFGLFCVGTVLAVNAQITVIQRHWTGAVDKHVGVKRNRIRNLVYSFTLLGVGVVAVMVFVIDLPGPLSVTQTASGLWDDPNIGRQVATGCVIVILGLVTSLVFTTAFGTFSFARNFPSIFDIDKVGEAFVNATGKSELSETRSVTALYEKIVHDAKGRSKAQSKAKKDITLSVDIGTDTKTAGDILIGSHDFIPLVDQGLSASKTMIVVRRFTSVAGFVMISALVTLSLGIDVLELGLSGPDGYIAAIKSSGDTWLMVLGAGMSAALMVVFGWPTLRLIPIAEAEPKPAKPSTAWNIVGSFEAPALDITASHPPSEKGDPLWKEVLPELGSTEAKFRSIMGARNIGGAFHELADQTLTNQITRAAGLLSPAIAGGLLTLLG